VAAAAVSAPGVASFRIPTMDCPVEEGEIRQALERIPGIRSLGFQLGARTLAIPAAADVIALALDAIRAAGYVPQALANADTRRADQTPRRLPAGSSAGELLISGGQPT
jgi:Cd2+/Zn2+-exporting ATPase